MAGRLLAAVPPSLSSAPPPATSLCSCPGFIPAAGLPPHPSGWDLAKATTLPAFPRCDSLPFPEATACLPPQVGSFFTIDTVLLPDMSKAPPKLLGAGLQALQTNGTAPAPSSAQNSTTTTVAPAAGDSSIKSSTNSSTNTTSTARNAGSSRGSAAVAATLLLLVAMLLV